MPGTVSWLVLCVVVWRMVYVVLMVRVCCVLGLVGLVGQPTARAVIPRKMKAPCEAADGAIMLMRPDPHTCVTNLCALVGQK